MKNEVNINEEQLKLLMNCTNKGVRCIQQAPLLENKERNDYIKQCEESIVRCYLNIILDDVNIKYKT